MMTFVLGGARSGKSRYAVELCRSAERVVFLATATAVDEEMKERIARHRAERPLGWVTVEAPLDVSGALEEAPVDARVLVDCLTLWISNLMYARRELDRAGREAHILEAVERFTETARTRDVVVVSNDVGHGLVPETSVGREFRDLIGTANQRVAAAAERVVLVVAGIPTTLR